MTQHSTQAQVAIASLCDMAIHHYTEKSKDGKERLVGRDHEAPGKPEDEAPERGSDRR